VVGVAPQLFTIKHSSSGRTCHMATLKIIPQSLIMPKIYLAAIHYSCVCLGQ